MVCSLQALSLKFLCQLSLLFATQSYFMQSMNVTLRILVLGVLLFGYALRGTAQCNYTIQMLDGYGDGWNGGKLTIINGDSTYMIGMDAFSGDGKDSTVNFLVTGSLPLTFLWSSGFFDKEVSFSVYDPDGTLIYSDSIPAPGLLYSGIAVCPSCLRPVNLKNANIYDTRAKLSWTNANGGSPAGYYVIYGPKGFIPGAPGVGDTLFTAQPKITLTGLSKKTEYDWYVKQVCSVSDESKLSGPQHFETYWTNDVAIAGVVTPTSSCSLGVETVRILMANYGAAPQSLIPFRYLVNGKDAGVPQPDDGFYTGVLGKDSIELIEFETTYDFSAPGEYRITVYTQMNGDEDFSNDTFNYYLVNRLGAPYAQQFEEWSGGWYVDSSSIKPSWQWGVPAKQVIDTAASGTHAWVTNLKEKFNLGETSYLTSPCFDFSADTTDPVIDFAIFRNMSTFYELAYLEMSIGGGAWKPVGNIGEGINWYNSADFYQYQDAAWTGNSEGWENARHTLNGAGGNAEVRLRFVFRSSVFNLGLSEGVGIDDVKIYVPFKKDLSGISIQTQAEGSQCGSNNDLISFRFTNLGSESLTQIKVAYSVNGATPVVETISNFNLNPDESYSYIFNKTFNSKDGIFNIKCWTLANGDQAKYNDTAFYTVKHLPLDLPLKENFEGVGPLGLLPDGWTATDVNIGNGHNNVSYVYYVNLYEQNDSFSLDLPRYGYVSPGDSLSFQYRITNYLSGGTAGTALVSGTKFRVEISDDCGEKYTTAYTIDKSNHTPTTALRKVFVGLDSFAGKAILVRFSGIWTGGDFFFDLDNININEGITAVPTLAGVQSLRIMPNPTSGQFEVNAVFEEPVRKLQISVLNLMGQELKTVSSVQADQISSSFDLSAYPAGMYLVRLTADGGVASFKVVKQ